MFGMLVNGTWNGMTGILHRSEAVMGVANFYITLLRKEVIDYSTPYDEAVRHVNSAPYEVIWPTKLHTKHPEDKLIYVLSSGTNNYVAVKSNYSAPYDESVRSNYSSLQNIFLYY